MGNEAITVTVSEFKAGKNASFLKNKKIEKLFVEYRYIFFQADENQLFAIIGTDLNYYVLLDLKIDFFLFTFTQL